MEDNGGFFEEIQEDDVEEVELSAFEEEFETTETFRESATYQELDGVLKEVEEEETSVGNDPVYTSEDLSSDLFENGDVRIIYVNSKSIQNSPESISDNQVFVLDSSQFEFLIDQISNLKREEYQVQTVSMNDYSDQLQGLHDLSQGSLMVNAMMFALCFGYFVKETVFRGL